MIAISAGHYPEQPGFKLGNVFEHFEAALWVERLATLVGSACHVVPPMTTAQKAKWINDRSPKYAIEIHFATDSKAELGPRIAYNPVSYESQGFAEALGRVIESCNSYEVVCEPGYYRGTGSVDFFLSNVSATAVLLMPGHITEAEALKDSRGYICEEIADFINKLTGKT